MITPQWDGENIFDLLPMPYLGSLPLSFFFFSRLYQLPCHSVQPVRSQLFVEKQTKLRRILDTDFRLRRRRCSRTAEVRGGEGQEGIRCQQTKFISISSWTCKKQGDKAPRKRWNSFLLSRWICQCCRTDERKLSGAP